jgi:hypothetical protein
LGLKLPPEVPWTWKTWRYHGVSIYLGFFRMSQVSSALLFQTFISVLGNSDIIPFLMLLVTRHVKMLEPIGRLEVFWARCLTSRYRHKREVQWLE